jgi:hypothetical protein
VAGKICKVAETNNYISQRDDILPAPPQRPLQANGTWTVWYARNFCAGFDIGSLAKETL